MRAWMRWRKGWKSAAMASVEATMTTGDCASCPVNRRTSPPRPTTQDQRVPGHSMLQSLIELMETLIRTFEPVAGTETHVLLDTWYSAKCLWRAARECGFLITTGLKSNRWLRVEDPTAPQGWSWQRLSDYTAKLCASDYRQLKWPKGNDQVYVHVVTM